MLKCRNRQANPQLFGCQNSLAVAKSRPTLAGVPSTPPVLIRKTRIVFLDAGQARDVADTRRTMLPAPRHALGSLRHSVDPGFRHAFCTHFASIHRFVAERDLGVALVAVHDNGQLGGRAWVSARTGTIQSAVIGRHPSVDLFLQGDASLSNRHLSLVIDPVTTWEPNDLRFRFLDLRTGSAMWTETGERVEALIAEGPAFVRIGSYRLLAFQTGGLPWPTNADDAWDTLPERVFVDEREAEPDRWKRHALRAKQQGRKITLLPGALGSNELTGGAPLGTLTIRSLQGRIERKITRAEAQRGVILGREPRCDFAGLLAIAEVSRVHMMIAEIGRRLYAFDTGSMAGIQYEGHPLRALELNEERSFTLGANLVKLHWKPLALH